MPATFEEKKQELRHKGTIFLKSIGANGKEDALDSLLDLLNGNQVDIRDLHQNKVEKSDIKELINEMRKDFKRMDERFEDMQKYMDKRFEDMQKNSDKRFEDMQKYMDKRFEAVDKRFEDMNKRFNSIQWMIGFGFTIMVIITTVYKFVH